MFFSKNSEKKSRQITFVNLIALFLMAFFGILHNYIKNFDNRAEVEKIMEFNKKPVEISAMLGWDFIEANLKLLPKEKLQRAYKFVLRIAGGFDSNQYLNKHPGDAVLTTSLPDNEKISVVFSNNSNPDTSFFKK